MVSEPKRPATVSPNVLMISATLCATWPARVWRSMNTWEVCDFVTHARMYGPETSSTPTSITFVVSSLVPVRSMVIVSPALNGELPAKIASGERITSIFV